jgi:glucose-6-phosphate 1-dehydrogenase
VVRQTTCFPTTPITSVVDRSLAVALLIAGAAAYPVNRWLIERRRTVTIAFREPPRRMFGDVAPHGPNELVFELGEPGSISSSFLAKVPGPDMRLGPARLSFRYEDSFATSSQLEAYERLIHDAMLGDQNLFTRADGVERLWEVAAAVLDDPPPLHPYAPGSWRPDEALELVPPARWYLPDALKEAA